MRSLFGKLGDVSQGVVRLPRDVWDKAPIPFGQPGPQLPVRIPSGARAQIRAYGAVGTLHAIVSRTSNSTSQVNWHLYKKAENGEEEEREEVTNHLAWVVWNKPNKFFTRQEFVETFQQHHDLTGEAWWIIGRAGRGTNGPPLELWPVRPDRMDPIPDGRNFLAGYLYTDPMTGEQVPLEINQVIMMRSPDPDNLYRGMSPVAALKTDLDAAQFAAQWNRNFFMNSAEPGGIIKVSRKLSDKEWKQFVTRWREQHQGVANAHRVAVLEEGEWVDRKYSMRDMQFPELRALSAEQIRQAYGFPKPMLGSVDDVNRANAEAAEVVFAKWLLVPRLERIKQALNSEFLPMFGAGSDQLEFDYDSPVLEDRQADREDLTAKVNAAKILIDAGFDRAEVLESLDLPPLAEREGIDVPPPAPVIAAPDDPETASTPPGAPQPGGVDEPESPQNKIDIDAVIHAILERAHETGALNVLLNAEETGELELAGVRADMESALDDLEKEYQATKNKQVESLADQIETAVETGSDDPAAVTAALLRISVPEDLLGVDQIFKAMAEMVYSAADRAETEVRSQGVSPDPLDIESEAGYQAATLEPFALTAATMMAGALTANAIREATRLWTPDTPTNMSGAALKRKVKAFVKKLDTGDIRRNLGQALHVATNRGRYAAFKVALKAKPGAKIIATEVNDSRRCENCEEWDGHEFPTLTAAYEMYSNGGYPACLGRDRCRGTYYVTWRD